MTWVKVCPDGNRVGRRRAIEWGHRSCVPSATSESKVSRQENPMAYPPRTQALRFVATSLAAATLVMALGGCGRKAAVTPPPAADAGAGGAEQKAAGNAAELAFLDAMTQHHREGIEMAR